MGFYISFGFWVGVLLMISVFKVNFVLEGCVLEGCCCWLDLFLVFAAEVAGPLRLF